MKCPGQANPETGRLKVTIGGEGVMGAMPNQSEGVGSFRGEEMFWNERVLVAQYCECSE